MWPFFISGMSSWHYVYHLLHYLGLLWYALLWAELGTDELSIGAAVLYGVAKIARAMAQSMLHDKPMVFESKH